MYQAHRMVKPITSSTISVKLYKVPLTVLEIRLPVGRSFIHIIDYHWLPHWKCIVKFLFAKLDIAQSYYVLKLIRKML